MRSLRSSSVAKASRTLEALNLLLEESARNVPMYASLYHVAEVGVPKLQELSDLSRLPLLEKAQLKASFPDRSTHQKKTVSDLYQISTSGTSDKLLTFHDEDKRNWDRSADLLLKHRTEGLGRVLIIPPDECYERCGLDEKFSVPLASSLRSAMFGSSQVKRKARSELASRFLWNSYSVPSPGMEGTAVKQQKIDGYFETVARLKPRTIKAFPYYFWLMSQRAEGKKLKGVDTVRPAGGKATPFMIDQIETTLGVRFRNNYGTAELGTIALDTEDGRGLQLMEHLFYVEFLRDNRPAKIGELAEIVITDLRNFSSPLIRYRVGDVGRLISCGDNEPLQFEVNGRMDETIITPSGKYLASDEVIDFFLRAGLTYFRLTEKNAQDFLLETTSQPTDSIALEKAFSELLEQDVQLDVRRVKRITPEPSGKYKLIRSESYSNFHRSNP